MAQLMVRLLVERDLMRTEGLWNHNVLPCSGGNSRIKDMLPWVLERLANYASATDMPQQDAPFVCYEQARREHRFVLRGLDRRAVELVQDGDVLIWAVAPPGGRQEEADGQVRGRLESDAVGRGSLRARSRSRSSRRQRELCGRLWANRKFADAVVVSGGREFPVHRAVLSEASPVFERAFSGPMREAKEARFEVGDSTPEAVEAMLSYIYTGTTPGEILQPSAVPALLELAVQYEIEGLCERAAGALLDGLAEENACESVQALRRHAGHPVVKPYWRLVLRDLSQDERLLSRSLGHALEPWPPPGFSRGLRPPSA